MDGLVRTQSNCNFVLLLVVDTVPLFSCPTPQSGQDDYSEVQTCRVKGTGSLPLTQWGGTVVTALLVTVTTYVFMDY